MLQHHRIHRAALACVLACAVAAPAASAQQDLRSPDTRDAAATSSLAGTVSGQDLRSPDARDAAEGRGTFNAPTVTVVKLPQPAPTHADGGVDWTDAGIGAGALLGVIAVGLAGATAVAHRRRRGAGPATVA